MDGKPADHIRVDYVLRGMKLPAGKHKIEFRFEPASYETGSLLTQISAILLTLSVAAALGFSFFRKEEN